MSAARADACTDGDALRLRCRMYPNRDSAPHIDSDSAPYIGDSGPHVDRSDSTPDRPRRNADSAWRHRYPEARLSRRDWKRRLLARSELARRRIGSPTGVACWHLAGVTPMAKASLEDAGMQMVENSDSNSEVKCDFVLRPIDAR
jgi:hypothetical protein